MAMNELPALAGSEKQIAWAERIREEKLTALDALLGSVPEPKNDAERAGKADVERRYATLRQQAEAGWWIDRRDAGTRSLLREM